MNNDFGFGLLVIGLILVIAVLWTVVVHLRTIIKILNIELEKLRSKIYESDDPSDPSGDK